MPIGTHTEIYIVADGIGSGSEIFATLENIIGPSVNQLDADGNILAG